MKKFYHLLLSILILFIFTSCANDFLIAPFPSKIINTQYNPNIKEETFIPTKKKDVDTLFLLYMDGDNTLSEPILKDRNEVQQGVNLLKDSDNVEVIVLWDGFTNGEINTEKLKTKGFGDSRLFRVEKNNKLVDISSTVDWMYSFMEYGTVLYEVTMSDPKTLTSFLSWANNLYNYNNIILHISNHGGGPGSDPYSKGRLVCEDSNKVPMEDGVSNYLGTKDVPKAIKDSGIEKVDLMIQDVCLGSTIEEVYEYIDVADYMLLSPNLMPQDGLNYTDLIKHITEGDCLIDGELNTEKLLNEYTLDFINSYKLPQEKWINEECSLYQNKNYNLIISTITGIKLNNIQNLISELNNLYDLFYSNSTKLLKINNSDNDEYNSYRVLYYILDNLNFYSPTNSKNMAMFDIGFIVDQLINVAQLNNWVELKDICNNIKTVLDDVIVCSWRDGWNGALYNKSFRNDFILKEPYKNGSYGISIAGYQYINQMDEGYRKNLKFCEDCKWVKLMDKVEATSFLNSL